MSLGGQAAEGVNSACLYECDPPSPSLPRACSPSPTARLTPSALATATHNRSIKVQWGNAWAHTADQISIEEPVPPVHPFVPAELGLAAGRLRGEKDMLAEVSSAHSHDGDDYAVEQRQRRRGYHLVLVPQDSLGDAEGDDDKQSE